MNTQPRDKKGRFSRTKMKASDWEGIANTYNRQYFELQAESESAIKELNAARQNDLNRLGEKVQRLMTERDSYLRVIHALRYQPAKWLLISTSIAFILGTIFFMIISKSK